MWLSTRPIEHADAPVWLAQRCALWPGDEAGHRAEIDRFFAGDFPRGPWTVLVAEDTTHAVVGFVEVSIRPVAEGCVTHRVAYIEGWFVRPDARGHGVGRALIDAAAAWGTAQGCAEMASDADPANDASCAAHRAMGFEDVGLVRCFRRDLG